MEPAALELVRGLLDVGIRHARARPGGFTTSQCWSIQLDDGRRLFAKLAADEESALGNRNEAIVLSEVCSPHLPLLVASAKDGRVLVVEDLSDANWAPLVNDLDDLWAAIAEVGRCRAPTALPSSPPGQGRESWTAVLADERFAAAVHVDPGWLTRHGDALAAASRQADTSGEGLVHGDLGPGNWCRAAEGRWRFVDWASAHRGNPLVDDAIAAVRLTTLRDEPCWSTRLGEHPEIAALIAGRFAAELLDVDWSLPPPTARRQRVADIRAGLRLAARLLELPPLRPS